MYTAWFCDSSADAKDQDGEWCACILISADSEVAAQEWGDRLAEDYGKRQLDERFLSSKIEPKAAYEKSNVEAIPQVCFGEVASDEEIGW